LQEDFESVVAPQAVALPKLLKRREGPIANQATYSGREASRRCKNLSSRQVRRYWSWKGPGTLVIQQREGVADFKKGHG